MALMVTDFSTVKPTIPLLGTGKSQGISSVVSTAKADQVAFGSQPKQDPVEVSARYIAANMKMDDLATTLNSYPMTLLDPKTEQKNSPGCAPRSAALVALNGPNGKTLYMHIERSFERSQYHTPLYYFTVMGRKDPKSTTPPTTAELSWLQPLAKFTFSFVADHRTATLKKQTPLAESNPGFLSEDSRDNQYMYSMYKPTELKLHHLINRLNKAGAFVQFEQPMKSGIAGTALPVDQPKTDASPGVNEAKTLFDEVKGSLATMVSLLKLPITLPTWVEPQPVESPSAKAIRDYFSLVV